MGNPFKKKKSTTVQTEVVKTTETKIVKLSYLQSLAINGGLGDAGKLAGTTEATSEQFDSSSTNRNKIEEFLEKRRKILKHLGNPDPGGITSFLFGKTVSRDTKMSVKDSGWSLVKTWAQPEFDIIRYSIGIRELVISQFTYVPISEMTSKPWSSPKDIQKITLLVDQFIPPQFPAGADYIKYYIKPDLNDSEWIRINPIDLPTQFTEDGQIVPRIITFNTERPITARLEESYITTPNPVKSVRFKAILSRPEGSEDSFSPILKSYRLIMNPRGGL